MERETGLDILRSVACFFVIAGHFYTMNTNFLKVQIHGLVPFLQAAFLQLFMIAVPLFVIITGYLNSKKKVSRQYYMKIWRILISYGFFAVLAFLFRRFMLHETITVYAAIKMTFGFTIFSYAWYIEMWIGLFLLTPFFNVLYGNLESQFEKKILLVVMFIITVLPHWINRNGVHLIPSFWTSCWPMMFYFIGAYIREYQPQFKKDGYFVIVVLCNDSLKI